MNDTDTARLAEITARAEKATPGPWMVHQGQYILKPDRPGYSWDGTVIATVPSGDFGLIETDNAEFIARVREDIPFLLGLLAAQDEDRRAREPLPVVAHKGPGVTDEEMFLRAARNLEQGYSLGGGNLTRAVIELLRREVARAAAPSPEPTDSFKNHPYPCPLFYPANWSDRCGGGLPRYDCTALSPEPLPLDPEPRCTVALGPAGDNSRRCERPQLPLHRTHLVDGVYHLPANTDEINTEIEESLAAPSPEGGER